MTLELHPKVRADIKDELELVLQEYPWFAAILHEVIQDGILVDTPFVSNDRSCGCFYGHLSGLKDCHEASQLQAHFRSLLDLDDGIIYTPIEFLLLKEDVNPGDTPETNEALAFLDELLQPYLVHPKENIPW